MAANLKYGDGLAAPDMVCSTAFDRDDEFFATAGVSRRVKVRRLLHVFASSTISMSIKACRDKMASHQEHSSCSQ